MAEYSAWNPIDLEDYYISPGLVDLNSRRDFEDLSSLTRTAALGGVTLVLDEQAELTTDEEMLYVDVGRVRSIVDNVEEETWEQTLALKCYLFPPNANLGSVSDLDEITKAVQRHNKLLIVDPLLPEDRMMHMASPLRTVSNASRLNSDVTTDHKVFAAAFPQSMDQESEDEDEQRDSLPDAPMRVKSNKTQRKNSDVAVVFNRLSMNYPSEDHNIYTDLQKRIELEAQSIAFLSKVEQVSYVASGQTLFSLSLPTAPLENPAAESPSKVPNKRLTKFRPKPVEVVQTLVKCKQKESESEFQYMYYLANFPDHWEFNGVNKALEAIKRTPCRLHFANLSSATAVNQVLKSKSSLSVTCETAPHFLYFTEADVERGNTRLKSCPPIRSRPNCNLIWDLLKMKAIDCISSHHRAIPPTFKALDTGSFKRAMPGLSSLGVSLQLVWTRLRRPCTSQYELEHYIVRLSKWMSLRPAQILGVNQHYGSIEQGKLANLIVWSPHEPYTVSESLPQYPDSFPYTGVTLYGPIAKVMLRGRFVVEGEDLTATGKVVTARGLIY
jgi:dihydroorotase-like cyclic amidohydrolase